MRKSVFDRVLSDGTYATKSYFYELHHIRHDELRGCDYAEVSRLPLCSLGRIISSDEIVWFSIKC